MRGCWLPARSETARHSARSTIASRPMCGDSSPGWRATRSRCWRIWFRRRSSPFRPLRRTSRVRLWCGLGSSPSRPMSRDGMCATTFGVGWHSSACRGCRLSRRTGRTNRSSSSSSSTRMREALSALPHDLRVALVMCDLEDIPGREAAAVLQIPEGTLYRRVHEARRALGALGRGGAVVSTSPAEASRLRTERQLLTIAKQLPVPVLSEARREELRTALLAGVSPDGEDWRKTKQTDTLPTQAMGAAAGLRGRSGGRSRHRGGGLANQDPRPAGARTSRGCRVGRRRQVTQRPGPTRGGTIRGVRTDPGCSADPVVARTHTGAPTAAPINPPNGCRLHRRA